MRIKVLLTAVMVTLLASNIKATSNAIIKAKGMSIKMSPPSPPPPIRPPGFGPKGAFH